MERVKNLCVSARSLLRIAYRRYDKPLLVVFISLQCAGVRFGETRPLYCTPLHIACARNHDLGADRAAACLPARCTLHCAGAELVTPTPDAAAECGKSHNKKGSMALVPPLEVPAAAADAPTPAPPSGPSTPSSRAAKAPPMADGSNTKGPQREQGDWQRVSVYPRPPTPKHTASVGDEGPPEASLQMTFYQSFDQLVSVEKAGAPPATVNGARLQFKPHENTYRAARQPRIPRPEPSALRHCMRIAFVLNPDDQEPTPLLFATPPAPPPQPPTRGHARSSAPPRARPSSEPRTSQATSPPPMRRKKSRRSSPSRNV